MNTIEIEAGRAPGTTSEADARRGEAYWEVIRSEFPVTRRCTYLRSAATGPLAPGVAAAVAQFYEQVTESGDCEWEAWVERREAVRRIIANSINAEPDEIAFTANTSAGMNLIVDACENRGEVISCELEFPTSTLPWLHRGIDVNRLIAHGGVITTEQVEEAMTKRTGVICLSHVQFSTGQRMDLESIGERKRDHVFIVNASQSAGVLPIDVKRMRIDALCTTGHKWMLAGFGTGFVYISRELLANTRPRTIGWMSTTEPFQFRNDEVRLRGDAAGRAETGTAPFPIILALGASCEYLDRVGRGAIAERALHLNRYLTARLKDEGWQILSPLKNEAMRSAETLVALSDPGRIVHSLAARNVLVTQKQEGIRVATHFFNDEADIERLVSALAEAT